MEILFDTPKTYSQDLPQPVTFTTLKVVQLIDTPQRKTVTANTKPAGQLLLWEGPSYEAIGQWTEADVEDRIREIFSNP